MTAWLNQLTSWGRRFISAASSALESPNLFGEGQDFASSNRLRVRHMEGGVVEVETSNYYAGAEVVRLTFRPLPAKAWEASLQRIAQRAAIASSVATGRLAPSLDELFGGALLPAEPGEVDAQCTCRRKTRCWHVSGAVLALADVVQSRPATLFDLRGRTLDDVQGRLDELRAARFLAEAPDSSSRPRLDPASFVAPEPPRQARTWSDPKAEPPRSEPPRPVAVASGSPTVTDWSFPEGAVYDGPSAAWPEVALPGAAPADAERVAWVGLSPEVEAALREAVARAAQRVAQLERGAASRANDPVKRRR
jgi:uncharacterized Zn finger protein